jgi:7-cyano-7-deazaguanine synthase in queuosine biosynthesis
MKPQPPDLPVFCGGLAPPANDASHALVLDTDAPRGSPERVNFDLGSLSRAMVANIPDRLADLIEIAAYVYCADQFSPRDTPLMRDLGAAWRRSFRFEIPVRDLPFWSRGEVHDALAGVLGFLSEDAFAFRFHAMPEVRRPLERFLDFGQADEAGPASSASLRYQPKRAILFSGGLDSFAGAVETLITHREEAVLISHQGAPLVRSRQDELADALRQHTRSSRFLHVGIAINKGSEEAREFTQRTRSFLFASLGLAVARLFGLDEVLFFENGVVSLNLPVAQHVIGARATRTTHPKVLDGLDRLFTLIADAPIRVVNPYFWHTKAEVVAKIAEGGCADAIAATFSCARVREAAQLGGRHCGVCSQCIDRRFGVLAAGQGGQEPDGFYGLDLFTGPRRPGVDTTLAESFVLAASKFAGMSEAAFLARYGEVFRALPYLGPDTAASAARVHDLHRRHGAAVTRVVDEALTRHATMAAMEALPDSCLLSLVRAPLTRVPPLVDPPAETDPSPALQAETSTRPELERPIRLAIDAAGKRVVFACGVELRGRSYDLFAELEREFRKDQAENRDPASYRLVPWQELGRRLDLGEPAVRKGLTRLRSTIAEQFKTRLDVDLGEDEVVQNEVWQGYRLNPRLVIQPSAVLAADETADRQTREKRDVPTLREMSRLSPPRAARKRAGRG